MNEAILLRAALAIGLAALSFGLYWLGNRILLARARRKYRGLEGLRPGIPAILYFTTPDCQPCKTVQRPALDEVRRVLGERVQIVQVDALQSPDLADYWGVLSVPTTFIIDPEGEPVHINHGVARADKLLAQLGAYTNSRKRVSANNRNAPNPSIETPRRP